MTDPALLWFREAVCRKARHNHGEAGELNCILTTLARVTASENPASILP